MAAFLLELKRFWPEFIRHHQQAKLQDDDAKWLKDNVGNGVVSTVQDFSQNDEIAPKKQDMTR